MVHIQYPKYVEGLGGYIPPQPVSLQGAKFYIFPLHTSFEYLNAICDRFLNAPSGGEVYYQPAINYVFLSFSKIDHAASLRPPSNQQGWGAEHEAALWILVAAGRKLGPVFIPEHLAWFAPYFFADTATAVDTGREVYGVSKQWAKVHVPGNELNPSLLSIDTFAIKHSNPSAEVSLERLLTIRRLGDSPSEPGSDWGANLERMIEGIRETLFHGNRGIIVPSLKFLFQTPASLLQLRSTLVALKQFRDVNDGSLACYQAVTEAPIIFQKLLGGGLLQGQYTLQLNDFDSMPLRSVFGLELQPGVPTTVQGFRLEGDIILERGVEVWKAETDYAEPDVPCFPPLKRFWTPKSAQPRKAESVPHKREKIVILGGGMGALAAAFELTNEPDWKDKYDVHVYQMGWRLGGKGASGRNQDMYDRIEEHGLHVWFGFYENAFRLMRECYEELQRSPDAPLATMNDAFKPVEFSVMEEHIEESGGEKWINWPIYFPTNSSTPGDGQELPTLWDYISMGLQWIHEVLVNTHDLTLSGGDTSAPPWWEEIVVELAIDLSGAVMSFGAQIMFAAAKLASLLPNDPRHHTSAHVEQYDSIIWLIEELKDWLWTRVKPDVDTDSAKRRLWIMVDLVGTTLIGMMRDGVVTNGFDVINEYDAMDWLRKHGATETSLKSAWVRGGYDLTFAYENGDKNLPRFEAGTAIRAGFRAFLTYKGAVMWKMQAGMGDVVFAPLYEVLKRRGVWFDFFHEVLELGVAEHDSKPYINQITIKRQVDLKVGEYDPLILVKGLPCWPSEPLYQQIMNGDELKTSGVNLEHPRPDWPGDTFTLKYGEDFDTVILGISLGALPRICKQLEEYPHWHNMMKHVKTVQTQAVQIWLKPTLRDAGWTMDTPIMGAYTDPLNTWASMGHLIPRENWPIPLYPGDIGYFCGPLDSHQISNLTVSPEEYVHQNAINFLKRNIGHLLPDDTTDPTNSDGKSIDWNYLIVPPNSQNVEKEDRFNAQYWRANTEGSELYVLSLPGSSKYRLKSDASGFSNLFLAGDWTDNGINIGCIEAAALSGLQAARGVKRHNQVYHGETDFHPVNSRAVLSR
jgi:uncharacterized protein with NAD-binding domain and iron-sulfur cluster